MWVNSKHEKGSHRLKQDHTCTADSKGCSHILSFPSARAPTPIPQNLTGRKQEEGRAHTVKGKWKRIKNMMDPHPSLILLSEKKDPFSFV